jgi:DNA-binding beta-propeller fold protein YncE
MSRLLSRIRRDGRRCLRLSSAVATALAVASVPTAHAEPFVYVTNQGFGVPETSSASQYEVGPGGLLAPLIPPGVGAGFFPRGVAVSPDGESVYIGSSDGVFQYDVGAGGALTPKSPPAVAGDRSVGVAVTPDGQNVYVTNFLADTVSQYDVGPGGELTPKSPAAVAAGVSISPLGLAVSPNGKSVYVAGGGSDETPGEVSQFDVGVDGTLTPKSPPTVAVSDHAHAVAVRPDGESVYVTNLNGVSQYDVGAGGALTPKSPPSVADPGGTQELAVSPGGDSVYVTNVARSVSQYDVGAGGTLRAKSPLAVPTTGASPHGVAVSPDGESVYVANGESRGPFPDGVSQYDVGADGALAPKSTALVTAGSFPVGVAVSPVLTRPFPTAFRDCKRGGWRDFGFKNQGQCIVFVLRG